jgi:hypothetical protein
MWRVGLSEHRGACRKEHHEEDEMSAQTITCTTTAHAPQVTTPTFTEYRITRARGTRFTSWVARLRGRRAEAMWAMQPVAIVPVDTRTELVRAQARLLAGR